jgi:hypothetical protein
MQLKRYKNGGTSFNLFSLLESVALLQIADPWQITIQKSIV